MQEEVKKTKILVIQTAFLGDVILALPLIQTIKVVMPDTIIDFICVPTASNVLQNHPDINRIIIYDKKGKRKLDKFLDLIAEIRREHYDIVLCPHRSARSALMTYFSKAKMKVGFDKNSLSFLLNMKVPYDDTAHEIERNLDLLQSVLENPIDESQVSLKPQLYPYEKDEKIVELILKEHNAGENIIAFAPCSRWFTKQFPVHKSFDTIRELIRQNHSVVLLGGGEDFEYGKQVEKEINDKALINLCGRLTPLQSYIVINKSKCLITVDSASQHLGAAADTPIVLIYGSTDRRFGFYPLTSKNVVVENIGLKCRPCTNHGRTECPLKHFKCMEELSVEEIVRKA
ncbi:MAG: glycosyltransferase family 9 protein, partial [Ginsengibacter sp.]